MNFESIETIGGFEHGHRADFKQALPTLRQLKDPGGSSLLPSGKALLHLGGIGKNLGVFVHLSITATMEPAPIDRGNLMDGDWVNFSRYDSQNKFVQNYSSKCGNRQRRSLSSTGGVKSIYLPHSKILLTSPI